MVKNNLHSGLTAIKLSTALNVPRTGNGTLKAIILIGVHLASPNLEQGICL